MCEWCGESVCLDCRVRCNCDRYYHEECYDDAGLEQCSKCSSIICVKCRVEVESEDDDNQYLCSTCAAKQEETKVKKGGKTNDKEVKQKKGG